MASRRAPMPAARLQPSPSSFTGACSRDRKPRVSPPASSEWRASASQRSMILRGLGMRQEYTSRRMNLPQVNVLTLAQFVARFGGVFEHSPWVAERAWRRRPFESLDLLHASMMQAVGGAAGQEQLALLRAHPGLAGREAAKGAPTPGSSSEQG